MSEVYKDIPIKVSITNKKSIIGDIVYYLTTNTTCKCDAGITWVIDVIDDQTRPAKRKGIRVPNTVYMTLFHGIEIPEPLGGGYRIRRYTTSIFVQAWDEDSIQAAIHEIQSAFNCWDENGGGAFRTDGVPFHRLIECTADVRGRASASIALALLSRLEARPT